MTKLFTKNRIIAGVVGLMAIVSVVNTQAIIKLSSRGVSSADQSAQVFNTSLNNCISLSSAPYKHTNFINPAGDLEEYNGLSRNSFIIGLNIRNTCNRDIYVVKDSFVFPGGTGSYPSLEFQDFNRPNQSTLLSGYSMNGPFKSNLNDIWGYLGHDMIIPVSNLNGVQPTGDGEMKLTKIPANTTKSFAFSGIGNASTATTPHHTRLSVKSIRWFLAQSYNDNILSSNDMKVYNLTPTEIEKFSSGYARFDGVSAPSGGEDCIPGILIGYDKNGNPIFCDEGNGGDDSDCIPGILIGYNKDGSPIYCPE